MLFKNTQQSHSSPSICSQLCRMWAAHRSFPNRKSDPKLMSFLISKWPNLMAFQTDSKTWMKIRICQAFMFVTEDDEFHSSWYSKCSLCFNRKRHTTVVSQGRAGLKVQRCLYAPETEYVVINISHFFKARSL